MAVVARHADRHHSSYAARRAACPCVDTAWHVGQPTVVLDAVAPGTLGREAQDVFWQASLEWIEALRQGGYVIVFRHGATTAGTTDE